MNRVDFYLLAENDPLACELFACRLCEQVYQKRLKIYMFTTDRDQALRLDERLWDFQDKSFIAHAIYPENAPVQIGTSTPQVENGFDVLINLTATVPAFFHQFIHIMEIVPSEQLLIAKARERFKYYRSQGWQLESHKQ